LKNIYCGRSCYCATTISHVPKLHEMCCCQSRVLTGEFHCFRIGSSQNKVRSDIWKAMATDTSSGLETRDCVSFLRVAAMANDRCTSYPGSISAARADAYFAVMGLSLPHSPYRT
jgi:hypothetical protein